MVPVAPRTHQICDERINYFVKKSPKIKNFVAKIQILCTRVKDFKFQNFRVKDFKFHQNPKLAQLAKICQRKFLKLCMLLSWRSFLRRFSNCRTRKTDMLGTMWSWPANLKRRNKCFFEFKFLK